MAGCSAARQEPRRWNAPLGMSGKKNAATATGRRRHANSAVLVTVAPAASSLIAGASPSPIAVCQRIRITTKDPGRWVVT